MIDGNQEIWTACSEAMGTGQLTPEDEARVERMKRLRVAMGYNVAAAWAEQFLGITASRWNNVERGMPVSTDLALTLVKKVPGLSLDWIYLGKAEALPLELARRLGELPSAERTSATTRS